MEIITDLLVADPHESPGEQAHKRTKRQPKYQPKRQPGQHIHDHTAHLSDRTSPIRKTGRACTATPKLGPGTG
jgi:hypothetical protein